MSGVFINSDMGEGFGLHRFGNDEPLLKIVKAVNLACGFHAGDPSVMDYTVGVAKAAGVKIGAHPGLPDLVGFGRRSMQISSDDLRAILLYQVGALSAFLLDHGVVLNHIKPHGSLYVMTARNPELALEVAKVAKLYGASVYGVAGTEHEKAANKLDVAFTGELYVDLDYGDDGFIVIRKNPGPNSLDAVRERVTDALQRGWVKTVSGKTVPIKFGSVCVHSDSTGAVEVAKAVKEAIDSASR